MPEENKESKCPRRTFCKVCIGGLTASSVAMVGYPIIGFFGDPIRLGNNKPLEVALSDLQVGQAQYVTFRGEQIIVLAGVETIHIFSASCPHLGCNVAWEGAESLFRCPCHGAVFDPQGQVISGPVSSPLKEIPFEIKDDKVIVT